MSTGTININKLKQLDVVQSIRSAETLDDALRIMNGLAANGWLTLWDGATHPDGSPYKDNLPTTQNERAYLYRCQHKQPNPKYTEWASVANNEHWPVDQWQSYEVLPLYTFEPKQAIPVGWISLKDRLPEVDQYCLYYAPIFEQKNAWSNVWAGIHDGNGNFSGRSGFLGGQEVTHWMPLPEAPTNTGGKNECV